MNATLSPTLQQVHPETPSAAPSRSIARRSAEREQALDSDEFGALLEPLLPRAFQAALHFTGDVSEAEDVVQDAVLMALKGFAGFQRGTNFKAWFLRVLTNAFLMRCRREKRAKHDLSLDAPGLFLYEHTREAGLHEGDPDPARTFLSRLTEAQIVDALTALPEQFRTVAVLYFVEDLSYQTIAEIVGTPVGTVRSRLHRARALLQRELWSLAADHGIVPGSNAAPPTAQA